VKIECGNIVIVNFPGAVETKRRPAIVVSSNTYHNERPDVVFGIITSQISSAIASTDYILQYWVSAGLKRESAFRSFFVTLPATNIVSIIGKASDHDWKEIQERLLIALAVR
jgi:mRNA interferase MazF